MKLVRIFSVLLAVSIGWVHAEALPAVAYSDGVKFDNSFNEAVFREGVTRFQSTFDIDVMEVNPSTSDAFESALRELASQGRSPIVAVGFSYAPALSAVAPEFPDIQFTIIDAVVDEPNVQSLIFKEWEGSFLVGALSAMRTGGAPLGFVGGMDLPFIRGFACGYAQGAHYVDDDARVMVRMIGNTPDAWSNPDRGNALAQELVERGAEVLYAAAGGSGIGVYQAAKSSGSYAIAVDSNQNYLHLGTMLTSMVKRVGVAAYTSWEQAVNGQWQPGVQQLGLAENGVDWSLDIFNRQLVTLDMERDMAQLRERIIDGRIRVHDYTTNSQCPVPLLEG
ncbi:BMP family lipoprotein [Saccharospirillum impatiens]|uniref:BMP family lipoprotein n=1 Tax=Saccharospirillum impatiens TaxID=169438 RepID=UPI00042990D2|nr:BMP family ABC transporter substrate-binding protein [Saccharospirillum impatiens]